MIRYTVVWHENAQNQLAQIWIAANDRSAVTHASYTVDTYLAMDPVPRVLPSTKIFENWSFRRFAFFSALVNQIAWCGSRM